MSINKNSLKPGDLVIYDSAALTWYHLGRQQVGMREIAMVTEIIKGPVPGLDTCKLLIGESVVEFEFEYILSRFSFLCPLQIRTN